jgi:hypothetical protein
VTVSNSPGTASALLIRIFETLSAAKAGGRFKEINATVSTANRNFLITLMNTPN